MAKLKTFSLCCSLLLAAAAARAQAPMKEISQEEYQRITQAAMQTSNYNQERGQAWDARLKVLSGAVSVKPSGSDVWSLVTEETPLDPADAVKTGGDGTAELYLDDKGVFFIGRNSELDVASIEQADMALSLKFGSLIAKVQHMLSERFKLQVRTPSAVCAVRGTEFAVEYSRLGRDTGVAVFEEGRLAVTPLDESGAAGTEQLLEKNSELSLVPAQKRFRPVPLSRMVRYRGQIAALRSSLQLRAKKWRRPSPAEREALRDKALKRRVIHKQLGNPTAQAKKSRAGKAAARKAALRQAKGRKKQAE